MTSSAAATDAISYPVQVDDLAFDTWQCGSSDHPMAVLPHGFPASPVCWLATMRTSVAAELFAPVRLGHLAEEPDPDTAGRWGQAWHDPLLRTRQQTNITVGWPPPGDCCTDR